MRNAWKYTNVQFNIEPMPISKSWNQIKFWKFSLQQNQKYGQLDHLGNSAWPDKSTICQSLSDRIKLVSALWKYQQKAAVIWISDQKLGKIQAWPGFIWLKMRLESEFMCWACILTRTRASLAGFRPNSEIIGNFRKFQKFYGHFVKRDELPLKSFFRKK